MSARGWQCVFGDTPECWVQAFDDSIIREGNIIHYQFNVAARVGNGHGQGYWDYPWFVDLSVNNQNLSANRLIKPNTAWHRVIRGQEHYMHLYSGYYTGSITVGSLDTSIRLYIFFHDTMGHTGAAEYWIPIPRASAPYNVNVGNVEVKTTSALIPVSCLNDSRYSKVNRWRIDYGESTNFDRNISVDTNNLDTTFQVNDLKSGTRYYYRITVYTDIGLSSQIEGSFMTPDIIYAKRVAQNEKTVPVRGVVIYPDGKIKRIEGIKVVK